MTLAPKVKSPPKQSGHAKVTIVSNGAEKDILVPHSLSCDGCQQGFAEKVNRDRCKCPCHDPVVPRQRFV